MRVRVTGIKQYQDRHGKWRRYYRRKGAPSVPISMDLKGAALAAEIARLDALYKPLTPVAGTLRVLLADYRTKSAHWKGLRDRTQADYERVFDHLENAMDHGLTRFTPPVIVAMRDKAAQKKGFKFANQMLATLRMVFAFGVEYGHIKDNPAKDVMPVARPTDLPDANRPWSAQEAVAMTTELPIWIAAPTAIAAYLGVREGDVLKLPRTAAADELLSFTTSKTRRPMELPLCDDLRAILNRYLAWRKAFFAKKDREDLAMTLFINSRGKPWTIDGFKTSFAKERDKLLEAEKIEAGLTFHGARHTVSTILAEADFDAGKVKHLLGHGTANVTEHYSRRAKRRAMLREMAEAVQMAYREGGANVVRLDRTGNESD